MAFHLGGCVMRQEVMPTGYDLSQLPAALPLPLVPCCRTTSFPPRLPQVAPV